jgi:hypothetical protein
MNRPAFALAITLGLALVGATDGVAFAQPGASTRDARAEARDRFDRGLRLFNAGDNAGALVEFRRAYELVANEIVLYNIGLVYAQMGRAVDATDALDRVLASPGSLSSERLALAKRTRDEQAARVAEVAVDANVEGARVEVDGIETAKTPLSKPLRLPSGTHVIGLIAPGFSPQRKEIAIAGGQKQSLHFALVAMQGRLAHLVVKTHLPGADLFVDDDHVGTTPLAASVSLSPGHHRVELRRAGYTTSGTDVALSDSATGEVELDPREDPGALGAIAGTLALDVSETGPVVTVDGRPRALYAAPLRLAAGVHHVLVERENFIPLERDVTVVAGQTTEVHVGLDPTPEYRARFSSHAHAQRTWGLVSLIGGAVLVAGSTALVVYDAGQRGNATTTRNGLLAQDTLHSNEPCDMGQDPNVLQQTCYGPVNAAAAKIADANTRDDVAWTALGVGAAGAVLGVVLWVTSDDPHKYDPSEAAGATHVSVPTFWIARGGGGLGLHGSF